MPSPGACQRASAAGEERLLVFDEAEWVSPLVGAYDRLGIHAQAGDVNRLVVSAANLAFLREGIGAGSALAIAHLRMTGMDV